MHHPPLFAKRAEKQGSLNWLTASSFVNYELWLNNSAQWCIQLSSRHVRLHLGGNCIGLFTQVSSSLLAVVRLRLVSGLLHCDWVTWSDILFTWFHGPYLRFPRILKLVLTQCTCRLSLTFAKIFYSYSQQRKLSSKLDTLKWLPNADNWLKHIPCEFCNRYYWYQCVQDFEKQEKWESVVSWSAVSTDRLRDAVAKRTRRLWWYHLKWLFKWSYWIFCNHRNKKLKQLGLPTNFTLNSYSLLSAALLYV